MKLVRYGELHAEKPALLDPNGLLRDLSGVIPDLGPPQLRVEVLARLAQLDPEVLPVVPGSPRIGAAIARTGKFVAIGLNYSDHAAEARMPLPAEPIVFMKAPNCLSGPNDPVMIPQGSLKTDWEVELGVVIGRIARYVDVAQALDCVAGYLLVNDLSERAYQLERGGSWDKGKGCDSFGPIGPWLVTPDELGDPQNVDLWLDVNGKRMQTGNTRTMVFTVADIIAYVSRFMTLLPGDIITTGTPPGVGMGQRPEPVYLRAGDEIRLGSSKLGTQRQVMEAWSEVRAHEADERAEFKAAFVRRP